MMDYHTWVRGRRYSFRSLLITLLLYLLVTPFLKGFPALSLLVHCLLTVALFFSVYAVRGQRWERLIALLLLLPLVAGYWLNAYWHWDLGLIVSLLFIIFFINLIRSYIRQLARVRKINGEVISAALCLYLIIGLFWGALYKLLNDLQPGSFSGALLDQTGGSYQVFQYLSMVTLTTLGYGDIIPRTLGAAALCRMEAIIGQFYIAVVVAWLVGNLAASRQSS